MLLDLGLLTCYTISVGTLAQLCTAGGTKSNLFIMMDCDSLG